MCTASEATTAVRVNSSGEINNMVAGFGENTGSANADVSVFAVEIEMAGTVMVEKIRRILPGFKGKIDGGRQMLFVIVFRGAQINQETAWVGREGVKVIDPQ